MANRYQDIYPEAPLINSAELLPLVTDLLTLEFFEAEPGEMPHQVFDQHHILINLQETPHRVENWRDEEYRDFTYHKNEIIVTPAGVRSGWKWHSKSRVIVITLEPKKLEKFVQSELGILLTDKQLEDIPQFIDEDLTQAGVMLMDALKSDLGSAVMFESFARVFLTKLVQKYGLEQDEDIAFSTSFTSKHFKRVLDFVAKNYGKNIALEDMAAEAALSPFHFSRVFKKTIGHTPHQFLVNYRIEQARKMLLVVDRPMIDIAMACGFSDQAHFSRVFKQIAGTTPNKWRKQHSKNLQK